jgi:hypothetical protein
MDNQPYDSFDDPFGVDGRFGISGQVGAGSAHDVITELSVPRLLDLDIDQLSIDLSQPRRYLEPYRNNRMLSAPGGVLDALEADALAGNPIAAAYWADMRELADNIARIGLKYPLQVIQRTGDHERFTIVDGERRYWALRLLCRSGGVSAHRAPCLLVDARETLDALEATQWSVNTQRADLSWVEIADWVSTTYQATLRERHAVAVNADATSGPSQQQAAIMRVGDLLYERSGRRVSERTLFLLRRISDTLSDDVKRLASAHRVGQNVLARLTRIASADKQLRALRNQLGLDHASPDSADGASRGGRPNSLARCGNALLDALDLLAKIDDRGLKRLDPGCARELIDHMIATHEQLRERILRVERMLASAAPGGVTTGEPRA